MYAVILTGGHQYRVEQGAVLRVEKLDAEPDAAVTFDQVLLIGEGEGVTVGAPTVAGTLIRSRPPYASGNGSTTSAARAA